MDANIPLPQRQRRGPPIGGAYDRFIKLAKDALPLAALMLLLAILILPFVGDREFSFILDKNKVALAGERLKVEAPVYKGSDSRGRAFTLTADRAVQKSSADPTVMLQRLRAVLDAKEGRIELTADEGRFLMKKEQLFVSGQIAILREDGYRFTSQDVLVDLKSRIAYSTSGIDGTGPLGAFKAGSFRLDLASNSIIFGGGTKLHLVQR